MRAFVCLLYMVVILVNVPMTYGLSDNSEEAIGPEDIKSLTWTTTESCLPLVELECPEIIDFLRAVSYNHLRAHETTEHVG